MKKGFLASRLLAAWFLASAWSGAGLAAAPADDASLGKADRVLVVKSERKLYLMRDGEVLRTFRVALGRQPRGTKERQGDGRTPEGEYRAEALNPESRFYRAIRISYPSAEDRARARAKGHRPGGDIMIHGVPRELLHWGDDQWMFNWTEGCIAVTNKEMDVIWRMVDLGTPIEIKP